MPRDASGQQHVPQGSLPLGIDDELDRVFVVRFTGEVFRDYECDTPKHLNSGRPARPLGALARAPHWSHLFKCVPRLPRACHRPARGEQPAGALRRAAALQGLPVSAHAVLAPDLDVRPHGHHGPHVRGGPQQRAARGAPGASPALRAPCAARRQRASAGRAPVPATRSSPLRAPRPRAAASAVPLHPTARASCACPLGCAQRGAPRAPDFTQGSAMATFV